MIFNFSDFQGRFEAKKLLFLVIQGTEVEKTYLEKRFTPVKGHFLMKVENVVFDHLKAFFILCIVILLYLCLGQKKIETENEKGR